MKTKGIICALLALAVCQGTASFAQDNHKEGKTYKKKYYKGEMPVREHNEAEKEANEPKEPKAKEKENSQQEDMEREGREGRRKRNYYRNKYK